MVPLNIMSVPSTNLSSELDIFFKSQEWDEKKEMLQFHQYIINKLISKTRQRGLLVYHTMGFGKTMLAVSITEIYRKLEPSRKAIILLPKSLRKNFEDTLNIYMHSVPTIDRDIEIQDDYVSNTIEEHYTFISSNSSTMFTQIGTVDKSREEVEFEKNIGIFNDEIDNEPDSLENSVLVIDEFHNLSNAITNGSKNALRLYNKIMNTKDIKLLFLTGTPIINHPFELVCTFNMLRGKIEGELLFPENIRDFISFFVDRDKYKIKNKERFQNRIAGLVSYYGIQYFNKRNLDFPQELPIKIERVPMSGEQYSKYALMRELEKKEEARKIKLSTGADTQFKDKGGPSSSYRIRSRQVSNFLIPEVALQLRENKSPIKDLKKIPPDAFKQNLEIYSPKFKKIFENLQKHKGQLSLVFSQFTTAEGLGLFAKVLEANGYKSWISSVSEEPIVFKGGVSPRVYAMYSGDIPSETRDEIIKVFNSPENMHGELIEVLLISHQTGGTGLDLRGVRSIHIMEPYWNWALITQIIARGVRYKSHKGYPANEQNVQPYLYLSVFPKKIIIKNEDEDSKNTTDMHLYEGAMNNKKLIDTFLQMLVETSVDCSTHKKNLSPELQKLINCYMCAPTNEPLFNPNFWRDMKEDNPNRCKPFVEKKINTKEIIFDGDDEKIKYYYNDDDPSDIKLFEYNENVEGYMSIGPAHPHYADLIRRILSL